MCDNLRSHIIVRVWRNEYDNRKRKLHVTSSIVFTLQGYSHRDQWPGWSLHNILKTVELRITTKYFNSWFKVYFLRNLNESWLCFVRDWAGMAMVCSILCLFSSSSLLSLISHCLTHLPGMGSPSGIGAILDIHGWLLLNTNQGLKGCKLVLLKNSQMILSNLFVWITQLHLSPAARIKTKSAGSSSIRAWLFHDGSFCGEFRKVQFISS